VFYSKNVLALKGFTQRTS